MLFLECNAVIFSHLMLNCLENDCSPCFAVINKSHSGHLSHLQSVRSVGTASNKEFRVFPRRLAEIYGQRATGTWLFQPSGSYLLSWQLPQPAEPRVAQLALAAQENRRRRSLQLCFKSPLPSLGLGKMKHAPEGSSNSS